MNDYEQELTQGKKSGKSLAEQKNTELKYARSKIFITHFLNHSHHLHSLVRHFSGILDHLQSFIWHFLISGLHFFQFIFLHFKEISHSLCKATPVNEDNWKFLKNTHLVFLSQFELFSFLLN